MEVAHHGCMVVGRTRSRRVMDAEEQILEAVEDDPSLSTRRLAHQLGFHSSLSGEHCVDKDFIRITSKRYRHYNPVTNSNECNFVSGYWKSVITNPTFYVTYFSRMKLVLPKRGVFNMHNTHVWCDGYPHAYRNFRDQRNFSVNVWCGIVGDVLIGPHILPDRLTGNGYLNFLQQVLPNLLEEVPLGILRQMWYLHDGTPPHFARQVRDFLNVEYPNRWICRNGPIHWPARTPCDFYLWGHMKQLVYSEPVNSIEDLTARIRAAAETIREDPTVFGRVRASLERRARACIDNNGLQFQHLL
ncbi:hypothetical protein NQ318_015283 [Aromia moschata]|uniref:Transposase n=1 Tax=Aromia moschata TaxID=1265417 RepID=A0AAV8XD19_9CUCU|nr:hypothetical protein NQ318_015283 [Aromia moschata]